MILDSSNNKRIIDIYSASYKKWGYDPKSLGWSKGKQDVRFDILTSQCDLTQKKILDIGCGFGDLNLCLKAKFSKYDYCGIDIVPPLIKEATQRYKSSEGIKIEFMCDDFLNIKDLENYNYAIASGSFNYRLENQDNYEFVDSTIKKALEICNEGLAFDFLSNKVDYTYQENFYYSPETILSIAYKYSRNVIIRNDYMPFEFALFIFKDDSFDIKNTIFRRYLNK